MGQEAKGPMLEWPLSGDAISARGDETLGGLTKPGETARVSGGTCMVQPRDARKIPLTPRGSSVRVPEKEVRKTPRQFGGMVGGEPKARSTMWPARSAQLRIALFELARPALPPLGTAGQGGRYRG